MQGKIQSKQGEYETKGDYHREIDPNWRYYPIYVGKMDYIKQYLDGTSKKSKIIDLGCGEGVLVEEYRAKGHDIIGVDYNYSSDLVLKGDITQLDFEDKSFDYVLALDVIEHLNFEDQEKAFSEIHRILKDDGQALVSLPNLAHLTSRITFLFLGKLLRTSSIDRHKGDRPIGEFIELITANGYNIISRKGIFPTFPIASLLTYLYPSRVIWLHKILNRFLAYAPLCFLNIFVLRKEG
jgi:SAM-dependent methyltransferase